MATMPTAHQHIRLARTLPPRLLSFLAKYPPSQLPIPLSSTTTLHPPAPAPSTQTTFNPLAPRTSRAQRFPLSNRRAITLIKLAQKYKLGDLLPPSPHDPKVKFEKLLEVGGKTLRGTGLGQKVKGRKWERQLKSKLEMRRTAMERMPQLVHEWKKAGHGRAFRAQKKLKWPSSGKVRVPK